MIFYGFLRYVFVSDQRVRIFHNNIDLQSMDSKEEMKERIEMTLNKCMPSIRQRPTAANDTTNTFYFMLKKNKLTDVRHSITRHIYDVYYDTSKLIIHWYRYSMWHVKQQIVRFNIVYNARYKIKKECK